jgi:hypothetical protein
VLSPCEIKIAAVPHGVRGLYQFFNELGIFAGGLDEGGSTLDGFRIFGNKAGNLLEEFGDDIVFIFHNAPRTLPRKNPIALALWGFSMPFEPG